MALHMLICFSGQIRPEVNLGGAKMDQWGAPFPKDFFFRSECNSNKPNASSYPELHHRKPWFGDHSSLQDKTNVETDPWLRDDAWIEISWLFAVRTDFTNLTVMLSDLLRNLTFNRSAHCTQVSDQCPLGLLFKRRLAKQRHGPNLFNVNQRDQISVVQWICTFDLRMIFMPLICT